MSIQTIKPEQIKNSVPKMKAGYTVRVHQRIKDVSPDGKEKERIQIFEGVVLGTKNGKGITGTVTVRKMSSGVGVERIFPIHSPNIEKIEVVKDAPIRKAKLYYARTGKEARVKARKIK